jgi:hypothetical protein
MNSFGASHKLRQQRPGHAAGSPVTDTIYTHIVSEDARRVAAQLGDAVWGIADANGREMEKGSVAAAKPFTIDLKVVALLDLPVRRFSADTNDLRPLAAFRQDQ